MTRTNISGNTASVRGGAIMFNFVCGILNQMNFYNNNAIYGGGIATSGFVDNCPLQMEEIVFTSNTANVSINGSGGAIHICSIGVCVVLLLHCI